MIKYKMGDILKSDAEVILHQVNCQGAMNSGIAKQIREKYSIVFTKYSELCNRAQDANDLLGEVQSVEINPNLTIINIFGQEFYGYDGKCYTDYSALEYSLSQVAKTNYDKKIAIPYKMGCVRGGGDWTKVFEIIERVFKDCDVTLYEYNGG